MLHNVKDLQWLHSKSKSHRFSPLADMKMYKHNSKHNYKIFFVHLNVLYNSHLYVVDKIHNLVTFYEKL